MQHQSLTAQIASKVKKPLETFEPAFFSEIPYSNVNEINYLRDLEQKKKNIDFPIFEFQKDFGDQAPVNEFDMLANTLYKKIMQQGYIQQKKAPSKKKKKTKNPFQYDYEDAWINDEEAITVKKNIYVKFENFKCLNQGIDQFYNSEIYKSNIAQIQQLSKKRTNQISMDAQQLEQIKKKIKQNIFIAHNKAKQEVDIQKPTNIMENSEFDEISKDQKSQKPNQQLVMNEKNEFEVEKAPLSKQQNIGIIDENAEKSLKSDSVKSVQNGQAQIPLKKSRKSIITKQKAALPKKKKEKLVRPSKSLLPEQHNPTLQDRSQEGFTIQNTSPPSELKSHQPDQSNLIQGNAHSSKDLSSEDKKINQNEQKSSE